MSHKSVLIGLIFFVALQSCRSDKKKKETSIQPTPLVQPSPDKDVVINVPVVSLNSAQEVQLKTLGKSNAVDRCKALARLDSPMTPHDFEAEYTNEKSEKQKFQLQIKSDGEGNCQTGESLLVFHFKHEAKMEEMPQLEVYLSTLFNLAPIDTGAAPTVKFITDCETVVHNQLRTVRQKTGESLNDVKKDKLLKTAVEEICPQIKQQTANYAVELLSK
jgi:hypothetical protein